MTVAASGATAGGVTASEPAELELCFTNPKGELLHGVFLDAGSEEVVILCHGYMANHKWCQFPQLAAGLAAAGVSSYRFDHAMALSSKSQRSGPFLMGNHDDEVGDMVAAVALMHGRGLRVACLLGHSKGGINAVLFAARHAAGLGVPAVVSLAGRFRTREGVLQRFGADIMERLAQGPLPRRESFGLEWTMTEEDFRGRADLDMAAAAAAIPPGLRFLLLHGTADATIPWEESRDCAALVLGAELALLEGADHNFTRPEHAELMIARVVEFVKQPGSEAA